MPLAGVALAATLASALSGCSSPSTKQLELPQKNIDQWVMPLDQYWEANLSQTLEYSELLAVRPCMRSAGFKWDVPYRDLTLSSPTVNSVGRRIFNAEVMARYGYHEARIPLPNRLEWDRWTASISAISNTEFSHLRECQTAARKKVPVVDDQMNYAASLVDGAISAAAEKSTVKTAMEKWRSCMASQGIADLPASPDQMPSKSEASKWHTRDIGGRPSKDELAAAKYDSKCRITSGYERASYNAEWDEQVKLLQENQDDLERNKSLLDKVSKQAQTVIAANIPSQS